MKRPFMVLLLFFCCGQGFASVKWPEPVKRNSDTISIYSPDQPLALLLPDTTDKRSFRTKKIIASILSFPLPFGLLGLHRVVLGARPYIPFVYVGTLGGCFGILPLIDFFMILTADEKRFEEFCNNPRVFMWAR